MSRRLLYATLALLFCAGCAHGEDVRELATWTVVAPSGARRTVTLPARFSSEDVDARGHVVLETDAHVPESWQGGPVTLALPTYFGPVTLVARGRPAAEQHLGIAHAFRIDEAVRDGVDVPLRIELDARLGPYLNALPRLSATEEGDGWYAFVRDFNYGAAFVGISLGALVALLFLVVFLLDRRRRVYGWFSLAMAATIPMFVSDVGPPRAVLPWVGFAGISAGYVAVVAAIGGVRAYFLRAGWSLWWLATGLVPVSILVLLRSPTARLDVGTALGLLTTAAGVYLAGLLLLQLRKRELRFSATVMSTAVVAAILLSIPDIRSNNGSGELLGGLRTLPLAMVSLHLAGAVLLGGDLIRAMRETEARVKDLEARGREIGELNEELRHQVAERSRELTDALSRAEGEVAPATLEVGDVFDRRYRVTRALGRGGMGAVYEVERTRDGRRLALKVVTSALSGRTAARFARADLRLARVRHDNLVPIVDVGIAAGGTPFLVMELVQGGSLEEQRSRFGDERWAVPILRQIAAGLAELHANRIVHRDLKPANVLLVDGDAAPRAKISDFGISRFGALVDSGEDGAGGAAAQATAEGASPRDLTQTGALMGTPVYMPPEAWFEPVRSPSADVFSFGVLAYEALTGRAPFAVPPVLLVRSRQRIPEPAPLGSVNGEVARLVLACLHVEPSKRPRAKDLADSL
jgi:hypothetical protein